LPVKRNIISDEKNFEISSNLLVSYTYDTYIQGKVINTDGASEAFIKIKQVPCTRDYGPILEDKKSPVFITKQKILNFNFYPNPVVEYLIIELNEPIQKIEVKNLLGQSVNFNLLKQEKNKYQLNFTEKGFQNKRQSIFKHKSQ
jgi:hypothetical protein